MVHQTRALATVIDKRTFCHFHFTPPTADDTDEQLTLKLNIVTKHKTDTYAWTYAQLKSKADTLQSQTANKAKRKTCKSGSEWIG